MTTLITGASSGIGNGFARKFADEGHDLLLVDIKNDELQQVAADLEARYDVPVTTLAQDLTAPQATETILEELNATNTDVDILINNAGVGLHGPFHKAGPDEVRALLRLNVVTVTELTRMFLERMVDRDHGRILNISSSSAFNPGPMTAVYNASKTYILFFTEAVAEELRDTGVTVSVMCPDPTQSNFFNNMGVSYPAAHRDDWLTPAAVADMGYDGLMDGKTVIYTSRTTALKSYVIGVLPRSAVRKISMRKEKARGRQPKD